MSDARTPDQMNHPQCECGAPEGATIHAQYCHLYRKAPFTSKKEVSLSVYESAVRGRREFRAAYRKALRLLGEFVMAWEGVPGAQNMDRLCELARNMSVETLPRKGEPSDETTASPQAPIARIKVKADHCYAVELYAPGLPPGEHDLYCEPETVAPMMREKRAYYETHDPPHCPTCGCGMPSERAPETPHKGATPLAEIADKLDTAEDLTDCERGCAADALRKLADADVRHVRLRQYRMPARELPDDDVPESPEKADAAR